MKRNLRVLIVDDHDVVRHGLRRMLESDDSMEVVDACTSAEEAFSQMKKLTPDIVIMNIQMHGVDGVQAIQRLKAEELNCDADVIILAECSDYLVDSLGAGAAGYLLKDQVNEEFANIVRMVYQNEHAMGEDCDDDSSELQFELIVQPTADAGQLMRFASRMEKDLHASILQTVGAWDWGTAITIQLRPETSSNLLDKLTEIPDVESVESKPMAREHFPNLIKKFMATPKSNANPRERLLVTLR